MGSRKYVDGFAKVPPDPEKPGIPCDSCGMEVAGVRNALVVGATCVWCSSTGPARGRRGERLARRKGGKVRK